MRKFFKDLHIWLSIPLGLVISLICFTGATLIFEKEISRAVHHDIYYVASDEGEPIDVGELVASVEPLLDEGQQITGVTISDDSRRCYVVNLSTPKGASILVDQYTGEIKGKTERLGFFRTMFRLHRWLLDTRPEDGSIYWGKVIVGISTLLMVIIILTGVVIWWPKSLKALKHRVSIKVRMGWHRLFYDLHVAGGIYATLLLLVMALTGLTWSFEWYRNGLYSLFGVEQQRKVEATNHNAKGERKGSVEIVEDSTPYLHWQAIYDELSTKIADYSEITISKGSASVKTPHFGNQRGSDKYLFDNASGIITGEELYATAPNATKMRGWIFSLHVGNFGGIVTRIMWLLASLLGATLPLTGYYLWIKRKFFKRRNHHCNNCCYCE